ncbi:MAG TPA: FlgD immunoglobulin-like domain containing protein, partial [Candidatus Krumholzibacteria bacterium]|nr:FlgD immunoglobulin-like domain containing protein [Candidatus Krumholzibacteria bacterium]
LVSGDSEPGYDYAYVTAVRSGGDVDLWTQDGTYGPLTVDLQTVYQPADYVGTGANEVAIRFRFTSDGGWSDEDCSWPTAGAVRVDDVAITLTNGAGYAHDFEDGTLGAFQAPPRQGVGDFAHLWSGLQAPTVFCQGQQSNLSPVVAFIDDGRVVPGTGGTMCVNHCYGPGGYVVNNTGGLVGPEGHIHNAVESPAMPWPGPGYAGGTLWFDVFRDETLGAGSPGIFFTWGVRSTTSADPADLQAASWEDRNFVYYGNPAWVRFTEPVGDLIPEDAQWVQVQLAVYELGWVWGFAGTDGTPAPWFDNVRLAAHARSGGLTMSAAVNQLPHDAFPENGAIDLVDLGANHVRFDTGEDISPQYDGRNDPGDSVTITVRPVIAGNTVAAPPRMHWRLQPNPLFDPYRSAGLPNRGFVEGWQPPVGSYTWAFDLPDTGFLFPGDLLYYYFEATENVNGELQTTLLPADTTGFSDFDDPMAYPPIYKLHALPTLTEVPGQPGVYEQPAVLFWDDGGAAGNRDEWYSAYANNGMIAGQDYDIYYTSGPSLRSGHGLGGRATLAQVAGYTDLLYTSGVQAFTLSDGSSIDPSEDVQLLTAWLALGNRDLLLAGDDIAGELNRLSSVSFAFLHDWMGVDLVEENVLDVLDEQTAPLVVVDQGGVLTSLDRWSAAASCLSATWSGGYYNVEVTTQLRYDGVVPRSGAVRLAEFTSPDGMAGAYPFSAATLNVRADHGSRVISLPYDLQSVYTDDGAKGAAMPAARSRLLGDILHYFGLSTGEPSAVPDAGVFAADSYPNPFNPATTIRWALPTAGDLSVEIFDVRGRLVRTLIDGAAPAGPGAARWDGRTGDGRTAAAGVYFYRVRAGGDERVGKMALIK